MNKIAHIGIAVSSIEETLPFYRDHLGLEFKGVEEVESEHVKVAFLKIGESAIELLEPLNSQSPIAKYIDQKGEGIHHIALDVNDIDERLNNLKEQGIPLIHEQPKEGAHGSQIAFLHPKAANGVLFELCQQK
ncbi:methylmalonyl-CoA epimerase [Alkalibacillus silvisoli]|uniref:Methylmalonyl-CoA epimerase n=1 Tax=Alkalibacillus silvisoli TaxID=392823 RepID=A0ABN0ZTD5_9BACI